MCSNHLEKYYLNFSLSYWLIITLQDLFWVRPSDRKFRKWLVFNHKSAGIVKRLTCWLVFLRHFYPLVRVPLGKF